MNYITTQLGKSIVMLAIASLYAMTGFSQEKENGIHAGIVYPISSQGTYSKEYSNRLSLNLLLGISRKETAVAVAGIGNVVKEGASGFQAAGILNKIGGDAQGFTGAGMLNMYKNGDGVQAAGFGNLSNGNVKGIQVAGFMNTVHSIVGVQASGYVSLADSVNGTQVAGFLNIANDVDGVQVAGFVNMARKVTGPQISGFINLADSSEYPVGIINLIGNGELHLGVSTDDNLSTMVTFRSGSKKLYGIVGLGYTFNDTKEVLAVQYGLGAHFFTSKNFRLNTEATVTRLENFSKGRFFKTSLTVLPAVKLGSRLEVFGGPSLNYVNTTSADGRDLVDNYLWDHISKENNELHGIYIGYTAGVHFRL